MASAPIKRRLVFHLGGYDPMSPEAFYRRFSRELGRFRVTWNVEATASPAQIAEGDARWDVTTAGPNWQVRTECRLFRWDDVMAAATAEPFRRRLARGLLAFVDFLTSGALIGYFRYNWRYALFFLFPYVLMALFAALAFAVARGIARQGFPGALALGIAAGVALFLVLLQWSRRALSLDHLLDDWIFAMDYVRREHPVLGPRLERLAGDIVRAAREGSADEIVVVGHSLGAVLAVDAIDRALRQDGDLGRHGTAVCLLTVGSSLLKIGLHGRSRRFHAAVERLSLDTTVLWAEYQALVDIMNFYKSDPVAAMRLKPTGKPIVRVVRLRNMLSEDIYRRIRGDFFRLHCQFVSGNDRRAAYDYFMTLCGPLPLMRLAQSRQGAGAAIGPDGGLDPKINWSLDAKLAGDGEVEDEGGSRRGRRARDWKGAP